MLGARLEDGRVERCGDLISRGFNSCSSTSVFYQLYSPSPLEIRNRSVTRDGIAIHDAMR